MGYQKYIISFTQYVLNWLSSLYGLFTEDETKRRLENYRAVAKKRKELVAARLQRQNLKLDYDPSKCGSLSRFKTCKDVSPCLFAKTAKLWGSPDYDRSMSLQENVRSLMPALLKFVSLVEEENVNLDGFLIEIRGDQYCKDLKSFSATAKEVLGCISATDPSGLHCMRMKSILSPSWHFSLCTVPIFVTSFAPFYGPSSSRYMGKLTSENEDSCFLLFQPEESFYKHKIGADSAETKWEEPVSMRDKIRVNFRQYKQDYYIPPTTSYAVAKHFVPHPENNCTDTLLYPLVHFWEEDEEGIEDAA